MSENDKTASDTQEVQLPDAAAEAAPAPKAPKAPASGTPGDSKGAQRLKGLFGKGKKADKPADPKNAKAAASKLKDNWKKQPRKRKIIILAAVAAVLAAAVIITVSMNSAKPVEYVPLYSDLDASEASDVLTAVQQKGVAAKLEKGNVMVPSDRYDELLLELAAEGYPKSTLAYSVYNSKNNLTATDQDTKTYYLYQTQDRLQSTLKRISGVANAVVTLTPANDSNYVWQQANSSDKASGSVLVTMSPNRTLSESQVYAIKALVSHALYNLSANDVAVVDARTGQELSAASGSSSSDSLTNTTALDCEQLYQKKLEENVKKLLQSRYGSNGVVASAKVTLDFDKMMQEKNDLTRPANGKDAVRTESHAYNIAGTQTAASGVAGQTNNTDVPTYVNSKSPTSNGGTTQYTYSKTIDYGYIKTQIEKGQPDVKKASISVMVNDTNLPANKADLVDLVSKSTGIATANISVIAINPNASSAVSSKAINTQAAGGALTTQQLLLLAAVIAAVFIVVVVVLLFRSKRKAKQAAAIAAAKAEDQAADTADQMRNELEAYKKQLEDNARSKVNEKDQVAADEVRGFARENPQITAELLRSWLKEDENHGK